MASLGIVLEGYPDEVIVYVTDPKTGIQRKSKWPPTISEIVEACDEHSSYLRRVAEAKNWGKRPKLIEGPREERPTLDDLKAKYGKDWGLDLTGGAAKKPVQKAPTWDEIGAMYQADPLRLERLLKSDKA